MIREGKNILPTGGKPLMTIKGKAYTIEVDGKAQDKGTIEVVPGNPKDLADGGADSLLARQAVEALARLAGK
jgi:hypothetical protein